MSKKYFINNIDTFIGQALLRELVKEGDESAEPNIMGTYTDTYRLDKPKGVKKILKRYKPKLSRKKMIDECDTYIYDLHEGDIQDIHFGLDLFRNTKLEDPKTLILISNVMTWANTPRKQKKQTQQEGQQEGVEGEIKNEEQIENKEIDTQQQPEQEQQEVNQEEEQQLQAEQQQEDEVKEFLPFREEDYLIRQPHQSYFTQKEIEDQVLSLQKENLKIIIICSGILYGQGEKLFHNYFKTAWLQEPKKLPIFCDGNNQIPLIHVNDLSKFVIKVAEAPPENLSYLLALDNSKNRLQKDIIQAISHGIGSGQVEHIEDVSALLQNQQYEEFIKIDLDMQSSSLLVNYAEPESQPEFEWYSQSGISENIKKLLNEFEKKQNLRPLNLLLYNQDSLVYNQVDLIKNNISNSYRIPIIKINELLEEVRQQDSELGQDLREEYDKIQELLSNKVVNAQLTETNKVLFRVIKWRLNQNDCLNRGYILLNYPLTKEDASFIFIDQKKKLNRIRPKPKKQNKKQDGEQIDNQDQNQEQNEENQQKNEDQQEGDDQEQVNEEQNQEEEQQEDEESGPKREKFYPESLINIKKILSKPRQNFDLSVIDFIEENGMDILIYDPSQKNEFEVLESLRMYIERHGRPYNYLLSPEELQKQHQEYYEQLSQNIYQQKKNQLNQEYNKVVQQQQNRKKLSAETIQYVKKNELDPETQQTFPFRQYLMQNVFPLLNDALLEVSENRPHDPVDFLAEFLYEKSFYL